MCKKIICPNCGEVIEESNVTVVKDSLGNCATCPKCKGTADIEMFEKAQ